MGSALMIYRILCAMKVIKTQEKAIILDCTLAQASMR